MPLGGSSARSRRERAALLAAAFAVAVGAVAGAAPAAAQEPGTADLSFQTVAVTVWGEGTKFQNVVDAAPGDALNFTVVVRVGRNHLAESRPATLNLTIEADEGVVANGSRTFAVGPGTPRALPLEPMNLSLPDALPEGRYRVVLVLDAGSWDLLPASNRKEVDLFVGLQPLLLLGLGALQVAPFVVFAALIAAAFAWARLVHRPAVQASLGGLHRGWERLLGAWLQHPRRARNEVLAAGVLLLALVVALASSPFFRSPPPDLLLRQAVVGILAGSIYALLALGYTMVYGVLKFINFAHGEIAMWGAYGCLFAGLALLGLGVAAEWAFLLAVLGSLAFAGLLGAATERVAYRPLRRRPRLAALITAIGVSLLLSSTAQFLFTTRPKTFNRLLAGEVAGGRPLLIWLAQGQEFLGVHVSHLEIVAFAAAVTLMVALHALVRHSKLGKAMRAVSDDAETASVLGVPANRVIAWTFVIGSVLAAVGGILFGLRFANIQPTMGFIPGIKAFTAAVVGGIGNIYGAFLGGFLIGLAENVGGSWIAPQFRDAIAFFLLILFLIFRPAGLFPAKGLEVRRK